MRTGLVLAFLLAGCQVASDEPLPAAETFRADLEPYGEWLEHEPYGQVWSPDRAVVGEGFVPYVTAGRWILSSHGWLWVSRWSWGWAPFHYGRWIFASERGWLWVPDRHWAPAWVAWRTGEAHVGWAALPPSDVPRAYWVFVQARDLTGDDLPGVLARREWARRLFYRTSPRIALDGHDGQRWYHGPGPADLWPERSPEPLKIKPPHRNEVLRAKLEKKDPPAPVQSTVREAVELPDYLLLERVLPLE